MRRNQGDLDRAIRIVIGIVLMAVGFGPVGGTAGVVLGVIGVLIFVTGVTGRCLIYALFGYNTLKV